MRLLRKITIPPVSSYNRFHNKYKYNLTWNIFIYFALFSFLLIISDLITNSQGLKVNILSFFMSVVVIFSLKITKKYNIGAVIVFITGTIINFYTLFTAVNVERIIDFMWMMSLSIFTFYMLGYRCGVLSLIINAIGIICAFFYVPTEVIIKTIEEQTLSFQIENIVNIIVAIISITYFMKKIMDFSLYNEKRLNEANQNLLKQRDEKVVMLQEIHHRVKNNLQIVSSLLRLQANQSNKIEIKEQFQDAVNRVSSMALIHEKIYQTDHLSDIDVENYLETLISDLLKSYSINTKVTFNIKSNIKTLNLDSLIPLSLIFNELITNSIKHAFGLQNNGEIKIEIEKQKNTIINYSDNGSGFNNNKPENFGSILIETFTEQLEGSYKIDSENGVSYTFLFPSLS